MLSFVPSGGKLNVGTAPSVAYQYLQIMSPILTFLYPLNKS